MADDVAAPTKRIGIIRILFPFVVIAIGAAVWITAHTWPNTNVNSSNLSIAKMLAVVITAGLLLLWALRMPGWRKRYVGLGFVAAIALTAVFVRFEGMRGNFLAAFTFRDWVQDLFFGGSPDTLLERHR